MLKRKIKPVEQTAEIGMSAVECAKAALRTIARSEVILGGGYIASTKQGVECDVIGALYFAAFSEDDISATKRSVCEIFTKLKPVFRSHNLRLMEIAYDGNYHGDDTDKPSESHSTSARIFRKKMIGKLTSQEEIDKKLAVYILKNVIENNGVFRP